MTTTRMMTLSRATTTTPQMTSVGMDDTIGVNNQRDGTGAVVFFSKRAFAEREVRYNSKAR